MQLLVKVHKNGCTKSDFVSKNMLVYKEAKKRYCGFTK